MMRYWKSVSIIVVVILVIGGFYLQAAFAGNAYPEFTIKTKSGDETFIKNVKLRSNYEIQELTIDTNGSKYQADLTYLDRLVGFYTDSKIKQLQSDYHSFMRGKGSISGLYENEKVLAFAEIDYKYRRGEASEFTFDIEMLDKESEERSGFKVKIPEKEKYDYVYVEDVRLTDDIMKVTTSNSVRHNDNWYSGEMHIYHFSLPEQKLLNDEIIETEQEELDGKLDSLWLMNDYDELGGEKYLVFEMQYVEDIGQPEENDQSDESVYEDYYPEYIGSELVAYNLETSEQERIELPEEAVQSMNRINGTLGNIYVDNGKLYFIEVTETGMETIVYNLENEKMENKQTVEIPNSDMDMLMNSVLFKLKDNKLYIVSSTINRDTQTPIIVIDMATGNRVYEGTVEVQNLSKGMENYMLNVYDLTVE